jgi:host factor-I protein
MSEVGMALANLQEVFLSHVLKNKVPLTVFLVNGVKLQGVLTHFDAFSVQLTRERQSQLVYKAAISTIMPMNNIRLGDADEPPEYAPPASMLNERRR